MYGKIQRIVKYNGDTIKFHYGPDGNRIAKEVFVDSLHRWTNTYYVHDAQGNIMATYQWINRDTFSLDELVMYGSSRLGTLSANIVLCDTALRDTAYYALHDTSTNPFTDSITYFTAGLKQYEFTNHLGNVLLTLTDRHIPIYILGGFALYTPEVASAQDYYPFGMEMVGRAYNPALYRFGFNGKENVNEVEGVGKQIDYGMRGYDPLRGQFWSVDPLTKKYPMLTPYQFASNNPIQNIDVDGLEGDPTSKPTDDDLTHPAPLQNDHTTVNNSIPDSKAPQKEGWEKDKLVEANANVSLGKGKASVEVSSDGKISVKTTIKGTEVSNSTNKNNIGISAEGVPVISYGKKIETATFLVNPVSKSYLFGGLNGNISFDDKQTRTTLSGSIITGQTYVRTTATHNNVPLVVEKNDGFGTNIGVDLGVGAVGGELSIKSTRWDTIYNISNETTPILKQDYGGNSFLH